MAMAAGEVREPQFHGGPMKNARARGYAYTDVGVVLGTRAVAVPVFYRAREPVAAMLLAQLCVRHTLALLTTETGISIRSRLTARCASGGTARAERRETRVSSRITPTPFGRASRGTRRSSGS
jgi:hypothetical protein